MTNLTATQWGISLALGVLSIPVGVLIRLIPNQIFQGRMHDSHRIRGDSEGSHFLWDQALENVRSELSSLHEHRGWRLKRVGHQILAVIRKRLSWQPLAETAEDNEIRPLLDSGSASPKSISNSILAPAAVMAGLVAGSVAGLPASGST